MKKIIITGGPSSGKTTIVEALKSDFYIVPEAALFLIKEKLIFPWDDYPYFQKKVIETQMIFEKNIPAGVKVAILDRSLIDVKAYHLDKNLPIPSQLDQTIDNADYDLALFLEILPEKFWSKTSSDKPRKHRYLDGLRIHKKIFEAYQEEDIKIIIIPVLPIDKRIKLVKQEIQNYLKDKNASL